MLRYYANVRALTGTILDHEGAYALSLAGAQADVIQAIRGLLVNDIRRGKIDLRGEVEITDEDCRLLSIVRYADAIEIVS